MVSNIFTNKDTFIKEFKKRIESQFGIPFQESKLNQHYVILAELVKEEAVANMKLTQEMITKNKMKQVYYFSMEFLMGRLLTNNLMNMGVYQVVTDAFNELGIDINEVERVEDDAGLGNGGLGRLAACFLDSLASLSYPGNGNCIRYQKGFFRQKFENGYQIELPEPWLEDGYVWEIKHEEEAVLVPLFGEIEMKEENGRLVVHHNHPLYVKAIPYDVPMVGHQTKTVNFLTLWEAQPEQIPEGHAHAKYEENIRKISESLYPDDSTDEGKMLRVKQQYFFVCAGLRRIINKHKKVYKTLDNFHEKVTLHINDTHPTLLIPELMRILIDEEGYSWDEAWHITQNTCAYTNHTILAEALEKWSIFFLKLLLPRIYQIIEEIDKRFKQVLINHFGEQSPKVKSLSIINNDLVHMAHICIATCFSVNGVAALHTKLLKEVEMIDFNDLFPNKFNNKTNGITHRRWAYHSNPQLTAFFNKYIGEGWELDIDRLSKLNNLIQDEQVKKEFYQVKQARKQILAEFIEQKEGIKIDVDSIFDIQVKRLHEYKRQLMNALHIMYLYNTLLEDKDFYESFYPQTFIFGAKAAGSYFMAKKIIKLINTISDVVNHDERVNKKLKVVFVENYNVSYAELIMPAANLSEQISTASKEASGTGNMKFMMNGALTIGTLDGANIEIVELAGSENAFIFGLTADEVNEYYRNKNYNPKEVYESNKDLKRVLDQLINGFFTKVDKNEFKDIYDNLLERGDYFLVLKDFEAYKQAQRQANQAYKDQDKWLEAALKNVANSAFFSSDRTIKQYAEKIWHLNQIEYNN